MDSYIDTDSLKECAILDMSEARREEMQGIQDRAYHMKQSLNRDIAVLRNQLLQIDNALSRTSSIADKIDAEKKKAAASKELKRREQTLFNDCFLSQRTVADILTGSGRLQDFLNNPQKFTEMFIETVKTVQGSMENRRNTLHEA